MISPLLPTKVTLLYVDDDKENLESFKAVFRREYEVLLANSAQEAIDILKNTPVQVLITDQRMPEMTGSELLEEVALKYPDMLRFMLTGFSDFDPLVDAINRGKLQGYFAKPLDVPHVKERIKKGLAAYYLKLESQRLNDELAQSEARLRSIFDQAAIGIGLIDRSGKFQMVNHKLCELLDYSEDDMLDVSLQEILFHDSANIVPDSSQWESMLKKNTNCFSVETIGKRHDNKTMWVSMTLSAVLGSKGNYEGMLTVIEDITSRKNAEKESKILLKRLQQSQKMEAIGTLAGGIAHDFNNILTSILGFSELAQAEQDAPVHLKEYLGHIHRAGIRAKDLVEQILTFARQTDEELKPVRVDTIMKEAVKLLRSTTPAQIEITSNIISDSLIIGNPTQIYQIIMNLCTNAIDEMETHGGMLTLELTDTIINDLPEQSAMKAGDYLELKVSDTGRGIDPEIMDSIFDPYFTSKEPGKGTGLGLATVHGIVNGYHGDIIVDSTLGKGTTFTILLPVIKKPEAVAEHLAEIIPRGSESILIVDDDPAIASLTSKMLANLGYQIATRTSSTAALDLFCKQPEIFDLVITDLNMPHLKGDQLAKAMIACKGDIPIILCTGYKHNISREDLLETGIKRVIQKPMLRTEFCKAIRSVLDEARS